eukprot:CAMPEP_0119052382 /NCGR_PEP_ID=MMETSP1177-20130426/73699_1 /TAXON_ID=2985 /ORGANISM="Ochromonas sp, Strain CCMP1899" /LENGTH=156 /DNA_ID=CAMNT_0007031931 /DNA_START=971 /DNA_END=1442 /DNA_ORIENTATION=-
MEEAMFLKKFRRIDLKTTGSISVEDVPGLLAGLDLHYPPYEIDTFIDTALDPDHTGLVKYAVMFTWFKGVLEEVEQKDPPIEEESKYNSTAEQEEDPPIEGESKVNSSFEREQERENVIFALEEEEVDDVEEASKTQQKNPSTWQVNDEPPKVRSN